MKEQYSLRFAGAGGQGLILASVIMAEAAVLAGLQTAQSQSYGPEARGGVSKAETILSTGRVWYTHVTHPDFLLAFTQSSLEAYAKQLVPGGVLLMDSSLTAPEWVTEMDVSIVSAPILRTASEDIGKTVTANIVAVGAVNALLGLFSDEVLSAAVKRHIPPGTEELNERALAAGASLITEEQAKTFAIKWKGADQC